MIPDWLSFVDIAYVAVALLFAMGGFQKGFAGQVAHILTIVAMGLFLFFAYPRIFSYLGREFRNLNETHMVWLILVGLAVLTVLFFVYVSKLLANVLKTQISDRSDRAYGFTLGLIRGGLLTLLAMVFLVILGPPKFDETFGRKSYVGKLVCYELVPRIQPRLNKSTVGESFDKMRKGLLYQDEAGVVEL